MYLVITAFSLQIRCVMDNEILRDAELYFK
jgi:hypothetical protein